MIRQRRSCELQDRFDLSLGAGVDHRVRGPGNLTLPHADEIGIAFPEGMNGARMGIGRGAILTADLPELDDVVRIQPTRGQRKFVKRTDRRIGGQRAELAAKVLPKRGRRRETKRLVA